MKHIFKANASGSFKSADGVSYDCKCINSNTATTKGWSDTLPAALKKSKKAESKAVAETAVETEVKKADNDQVESSQS